MAVAAVLDANVLYPIALADLLLTTAGLGLYRAHWSPELLDEVGRNLATNRPDLAQEQIAYRLARWTVPCRTPAPSLPGRSWAR